MRKLKYTFHRVALNQIYLCYVLPIFEYSSIVWDNFTVQDSSTLDKLQNEAARIVTGLTRSVSLENLYRECGWVPLTIRRNEQKLAFMYKAVNGEIPEYISDLIPPFVRDVTNYPLRNNNNLTIPFTRTETSRKSCIPSVSLWNSLGENTRNSSSLSCFKNNLRIFGTDGNQVPQYYLSGEKYWSVLHTRIRNNCSSLNNDLYNNHLSLDPYCNCGNEIEDTEHLFFNCPKFIDTCILLFNATRNLHPLNTDKLLKGDINLTSQESTTIFIAFQNYIKNTGRFTEA